MLNILSKTLCDLPDGFTNDKVYVNENMFYNGSYIVYDIICKTEYENYKKYNILYNTRFKKIVMITKSFTNKPCGLIYTYDAIKDKLSFYKKTYSITKDFFTKEMYYLLKIIGCNSQTLCIV